MTSLAMIISLLDTNPALYASIVVGAVISIVLHELAHGWSAIAQGDDTPRLTGHMTPNPVTHMGPLAIAAICLIGFGWGSMPVNPSNFRSKYGDAIVSFAGPLMNVFLALIGLTALAIWKNIDPAPTTIIAQNLQEALRIFGWLNILLFIFNLAPIPPLDGSRILANLHRGYGNWLRENQQQYGQMMFFGYFFLIFALNGTEYSLSLIARRISDAYMSMFL